MPSFSHEHNAPKDYGDALRPRFHLFASSDEPDPELRKEESFQALLEFVRADERLGQYLRADLVDIFEIHVEGMIGDLVDRYIHINTTTAFDPDRFINVYLPIEHVMLNEELSALLLVPLLFLNVPIDQFSLDQNAEIVRLSDSLQLARAPSRMRYGEHPLVQACATHALLLGAYTVQNDDWLSFGHITSDPQRYPIRKIDTFFAALRIATGLHTGYAQLLLLPLEWATSYRATLPPLVSTTVRTYPPAFENYAWNEPVPTMQESDLATTAEIYKRLVALTEPSKNPRLQLAIKRLNGAALRNDDEDRLVDLAIAFEALLSDGTQEMTYKIALRAAALARLHDGTTSSQIFDEMKHIYSYRSAIVHGGDAEKKRTLVRDAENVETASVALTHLRMVLSALIKHPEYLDVKALDKQLLLRQ